MTTKTRYFVIASLLVLLVGIGTGLVAYYVGLPVGLLQSSQPQELRYVPADATVVAYANVRDVMNSGLRQNLRRMVPVPQNGQRQFQTETGINIETDIDRIVACLGQRPNPASPGNNGVGAPAGALVLARGRFDTAKIEALMRSHGATVDQYKGRRLIAHSTPAPPLGDSFALAFMEPGLAAVGSGPLVRTAIDLIAGGSNVTTNVELMNQIRALPEGNAWAVGRFDELRANARLPEQIASQIPPINWFSLSSRIDSGIHGTLRADTRDAESAANLRDVVRGFVALAKLQVGNKPDLQTVVQSLELGGTDKTVTLTFSVPGEVFDNFGRGARPPRQSGQ